jgi:cytoskeleton protein RodZ
MIARAKPGELLQEARVQQGLSLERVSSDLKLNRTMLQALESDDYSQPLGQGYWRGHLRRYAEYLSLDPRPLIESLEKEGIMIPLVLKQTERLGVFSRQRNSSRFAAPGLVIFAGFVSFFAWFWIGPGQEQLRSWLQDGSLENLEEHLPYLGSKTYAPRIALPAPVLHLENEPTSVVQQEQAVEPAVSEAAAPVDPTLVSLPVVPEFKVKTTKAKEKLVKEDSKLKSENLKLFFKEECWVTVVDRSGKALLSGLRQGGEEVLLTGTAPFRVVLGNVANVDLVKEGIPVDLSAYEGQKVVRLSLD